MPSSAKGKLKVGCLSWCFHDFSPGVDSEPAIDIIGELGFDGIELIVTAQKDLKDFWSDTGWASVAAIKIPSTTTGKGLERDFIID